MGQSFIISVILNAYDAADVMDDDNYTTVLDSYVTTSSLQVTKVCTKKLPGLDQLVLAKRWGILSKKAMNTIHWTTSMGFAQCCTCHYHDGLGQLIISYGTENYHIMCTVMHYLPLQYLGEATCAHRYLPPILVGHAHSQ